MDKQRPVIVIGMHRSGTSIVAEMLSELGVHMGHVQDQNHEPWPYISLNNWILRQAGTTWEYPAEISRLVESPDALATAAATIERVTHRGVIRAVHMTSAVDRSKVRWGWKDPRNTATLPVWLEAYPDAQVIYVQRHGVPVAASLVTRHSNVEVAKLRIWHRLLAPSKPGPSMGSRTFSMEGSLEMWSDYCKLGEDHVENLGSRAITTTYEDLLRDPMATAKQLAQFLDTNPTDEQFASASARVRAGDPMRFRTKPDLAELEHTFSEILARHGYGPD